MCVSSCEMYVIFRDKCLVSSNFGKRKNVKMSLIESRV